MTPASAIPLPDQGLEGLDFVAVLAYLLVTAGIVWWSSRKQADTEDFFLGGRRMPWLAVGLSMMATLLSTLTYLSSPGEMIKHGVAFTFGYIALPFTIAVIMCVWLPFFMRLRITSAYEYLERRFNYPTRLIGSILFLLLRLGWMAMVVYTASRATVRMTGPQLEWLLDLVHLKGVISPLALVIGLVGVAATIYCCVGGIRAVIWADVLQAAMLFGGVFLILGYVGWMTGSGPIDWWQGVAAKTPKHTNPQWFSLDPTERITVFTVILRQFFWTICTHGSDQVVLQRYFSTNTLAAARRTFVVNIVSNVAIGLLLSLSGLALLYFYLQHSTHLPAGMTVTDDSDNLMPYFYAYQLPAGLGGLLLVGFVCDAMQTLVSGVNSIAAVATKDLFDRVLHEQERSPDELRLARTLTVVIGLIATSLAFVVFAFHDPAKLNIVDLMPKFFNLLVGPLALLFLIGMFLPRATARTAIPAVIGALVMSVSWSWGKQLFGMNADLTPMLTEAVPYVGGFLLAAVLSFLVDRGGEHAGRAYSWRAVLKRPLIEE
jgi:SSS family transporter